MAKMGLNGCAVSEWGERESTPPRMMALDDVMWWEDAHGALEYIYIYIYLSFFLSFQNSTWASLFFHLGTHVGKFLHVKLSSLTSTRLTCALFTTVSLGCGSVYVAIFATVRSIYYKTKLEFTQNNFDLLIY